MFGFKRSWKVILAFLGLVGLGLVITGCGNQTSHSSSSKKIDVVTSTDFYGEVAKAVVGSKGTVHSVINRASVDPHDYEPTPNVAKQVHRADIVVANGIGYDGWMNRLASDKKGDFIEVGNNLLHKKNGDNPHLWYRPQTMPALAKALATKFAKMQPANKAYFKRNADKYIRSLAPINHEIAKIKVLSHKTGQKKVYVSEPVFDYALTALGFQVANHDFEEAIENESDPSPKAIRAMQNGLKKHQVAFFVFNKQVENKTVNNLVSLAKKNNVPVLKVTETLPDGMTYQSWMMSQYRQLAAILK